MDTNEPVVSQNNGTDTSLVLEKKVPIMDASTTKPDINGDTEMEVDASISQDVINDSSLNVKQDKNNGETTSEPENSLSEDTKISDESLTESENALSPDFLGFDSENAISNDSIPYLNHIKNYLKNNEIVKKTKQTIPDVKTENIVFDTSLGKGKRSRIPNKRYESESMSSFVREDGGRHEHENETQDLSSMSMEISSPAGRGKYGGKSKKPIYTVDMTNPNFLIPFEHGWKRELVYRSTYDSNNRRNGDVYYYMPGGKKIRSMRELIEYLEAQQSNLKSEYFTFFKEPVGVNDTEKEIVRNAKMKGGSGIQRKTQRTPKATQKTVTPTLTPESARAGKSPRYGGFKVKLGSRPSPAAQKNDRKRSLADNELEMGMLPPSWSPKRGSASKQTGWQAKAVQSPLDPKPFRRPCSIRCQGVSGLIPTLQCRLCLCLYHKECVGEAFDEIPQGYVCQNCHLDSREQIESPHIPPPPGLTPITSFKPNNILSPIPPKLKRIPRPSDKYNIPSPDSTTQHPKPPHLLLNPTARNTTKTKSDIINITSPEPSKSISSLTTWLAPNSRIKMNNNNNNSSAHITPEDITVHTPQEIIVIEENMFVCIPKGNLLSIYPTINYPKLNTNLAAAQENDSLNEPPVINFFSNQSELRNGLPNHNLSPKLIPEPIQIPQIQIDTPGSKPKSSRTPKVNQREPSPPKSSRKSSRKSAIQTAPVPSSKPDAANLHMQNYLQNVSYGYQTLMHVFQYLKVQDLLRAGCVCTLWRDIASHPSLWRTVRMKNSQVANWDGLAKALTKFRTENLDLRKMLLPGDTDAMWPVFSQAITSIGSLKRIELCKCPASIIEELGNLNGNLQVINAVTIKSDKLDMTSLANLLNLQELRLKSTNGFIIRPNLSALTALKKLKHLSLTSVKDLNKQDIDVIGQLTTLESLDLGECTDFPENFGKDVLLKLVKLEKLRLEKGQGTCSTFNILEAVSKLPTLEQLEMVNFDVKAGFDRALGACTNIKKLLIIPTYISQSATTNHMVLGGVITLKSTLSHFVWGVTLELLRVTELFVDQCEDSPNKKEKKPPGSGGDSIPVLKPVPIMKYNETEEEKSSNDPPQVEILPLPTLQKLLLNCLPNTRVKILKIPFHATWRQSIVDTVN